MELTRRSCMCIWSLLVAVGVALVVAIGMMLFYSPGRTSGVSAAGTHAVHAPH